VSRYAANPDHAPEWYVNIKAVEWKTMPPVAIGSRIAFVAHFLGRRIAYTYEVVDLVPGERLSMRTAEGPFPMETSYIWETTSDGGTRMTLRNRGTPAGFSKWVAPFLAGAMRRANRKDLAALKIRGSVMVTPGDRRILLDSPNQLPLRQRPLHGERSPGGDDEAPALSNCARVASAGLRNHAPVAMITVRAGACPRGCVSSPTSPQT
jgi:hypothetical protein